MKKLFLLLALLAAPLGAADDDAIALLEKFDWAVESELESNKMTIPTSFAGIPWLHYQSASLQIRLDLDVAAGREINLRKFLLTQRGATHGSQIYAHIAEDGGKVIGAWLSTDAPVAPGIGSVGDRDFAKNL